MYFKNLAEKRIIIKIGNLISDNNELIVKNTEMVFKPSRHSLKG